MRFYGGAKNDIVTKNVDIFSSDLLQVGGGVKSQIRVQG